MGIGVRGFVRGAICETRRGPNEILVTGQKVSVCKGISLSSAKNLQSRAIVNTPLPNSENSLK